MHYAQKSACFSENKQKIITNSHSYHEEEQNRFAKHVSRSKFMFIVCF